MIKLPALALATSFFFLSFSLKAEESDHESLRQEKIRGLLLNSKKSLTLQDLTSGLSNEDQLLIFDDLENALSETNNKDSSKLLGLLRNIPEEKLSSALQARLFTLLADNHLYPTQIGQLAKALLPLVKKKSLTERDIHTLLGPLSDLGAKSAGPLLRLKTALMESYPLESKEVAKLATVTGPSDQEIKSIVNFSPPTSSILEAKYQGAFRLYMFCRMNRSYKCLMVMKTAQGQLVYDDATNRPWGHQALAYARNNLPGNRKNGNTPKGVMFLDSVMPVADRKADFGKYRRLKIAFVPASTNEITTKALLPRDSQNGTWWNEATLARKAGRNSLRIHGTGHRNNLPASTNYPFVRTSGCVSQREGLYDGLTYIDQRHLLDKMMETLNLAAVFANETKIKAVFYVIPIDDEQRNVSLSDLTRFGI